MNMLFFQIRRPGGQAVSLTEAAAHDLKGSIPDRILS